MTSVQRKRVKSVAVSAASTSARAKRLASVSVSKHIAPTLNDADQPSSSSGTIASVRRGRPTLFEASQRKTQPPTAKRTRLPSSRSARAAVAVQRVLPDDCVDPVVNTLERGHIDERFRHCLRLQIWLDDVATCDGEWPPLPEFQLDAPVIKPVIDDGDDERYGIAVDALFARSGCRAMHIDVRSYFIQRMRTITDKLIRNLKHVIKSTSQERAFAFKSPVQNSVLWSLGVHNLERMRVNYDIRHTARNDRMRVVCTNAVARHAVDMHKNAERTLMKRERDQVRRQARRVVGRLSSDDDEFDSDIVATGDVVETDDTSVENVPDGNIFDDMDDYD